MRKGDIRSLIPNNMKALGIKSSHYGMTDPSEKLRLEVLIGVDVHAIEFKDGMSRMEFERLMDDIGVRVRRCKELSPAK